MQEKKIKLNTIKKKTQFLGLWHAEIIPTENTREKKQEEKSQWQADLLHNLSTFYPFCLPMIPFSLKADIHMDMA